MIFLIRPKLHSSRSSTRNSSDLPFVSLAWGSSESFNAAFAFAHQSWGADLGSNQRPWNGRSRIPSRGFTGRGSNYLSDAGDESEKGRKSYMRVLSHAHQSRESQIRQRVMMAATSVIGLGSVFSGIGSLAAGTTILGSSSRKIESGDDSDSEWVFHQMKSCPKKKDNSK